VLQGFPNQLFAFVDDLDRAGRQARIVECPQTPQGHCYAGELLRRLVLEGMGNPLALLVLRDEQLRRQQMQSLLGSFEFRDVVSHAPDNRAPRTLRSKSVLIFPNSPLPGTSHDSHQSAGVSVAPNFVDVAVILVSQRRLQHIADSTADELSRRVAKDSRRQFIHPQKAALQVMETDQIAAVFNQIAVPFLAFS
jgi:hypothetical protein